MKRFDVQRGCRFAAGHEGHPWLRPDVAFQRVYDVVFLLQDGRFEEVQSVVLKPRAEAQQIVLTLGGEWGKFSMLIVRKSGEGREPGGADRNSSQLQKNLETSRSTEEENEKEEKEN